MTLDAPKMNATFEAKEPSIKGTRIGDDPTHLRYDGGQILVVPAETPLALLTNPTNHRCTNSMPQKSSQIDNRLMRLDSVEIAPD